MEASFHFSHASCDLTLTAVLSEYVSALLPCVLYPCAAWLSGCGVPDLAVDHRFRCLGPCVSVVTDLCDFYISCLILLPGFIYNIYI